MKSLLVDIERLLNSHIELPETGCVVVVGDLAEQAVKTLCRMQPHIVGEALSFAQADLAVIDPAVLVAGQERPWNLAVVVQADFELPDRPLDGVIVKTLLCRFRDIQADKVLHIVISDTRSEGGWTLTDSLELGFSVLYKNVTENRSTALYGFSMQDYKASPDWLNARHWAHPHLWDRDK